MREIMGLLMLILSLAGCGEMEQATQIERDDSSIAADIVLVSETTEEIAGLLQIRCVFLVPETFSEADVETHTAQHVAALQQQYPNFYVLMSVYYDDLLFYEFGDCPLATARWGPHAATLYPEDEYTAGDFSTHKTLIDYQALNEEYIMTDAQKLLYRQLQEYSIQKRGKEVASYSDPVTSPEVNKIYHEVAEAQGATYEEVAWVREAATYRRQWEEIDTFIEKE